MNKQVDFFLRLKIFHICLFGVHVALVYSCVHLQVSLSGNFKGVETKRDDELLDDSCKGVGEEECLVRRTLAAHIDYIYTQKHHP
ncbi:hypothetical protein ACJRO7_031174 [Eucalyptus globulus]|uniref:Phytosulfokine n=1 Tax=Eucalyptus globulus TaxID=34317 RepID=A0ABD3JLC4_EUCGL